MSDFDPLTIEDAVSYRRRFYIGTRCMALAEDGPWSSLESANDPETAASDAISDILTGLFGPAGTISYTEGDTRYEFNFRDEAIEAATRLLADAMESWRGDAEDYIDGEAV